MANEHAWCLSCYGEASFDTETGDLYCSKCGYTFGYGSAESYKEAFNEYGPPNKQLAGPFWENIEAATPCRKGKYKRGR